MKEGVSDKEEKGYHEEYMTKGELTVLTVQSYDQQAGLSLRGSHDTFKELLIDAKHQIRRTYQMS